MKEASGELSLTAITAVAIGAIALLFYNFVWPMIQLSIVNNTCETMGAGWKASKTDTGDCQAANEDEDAGGTTYYCCPDK